MVCFSYFQLTCQLIPVFFSLNYSEESVLKAMACWRCWSCWLYYLKMSVLVLCQGNWRALPPRDAGSWGREGAHADGGRWVCLYLIFFMPFATKLWRYCIFGCLSMCPRFTPVLCLKNERLNVGFKWNYHHNQQTNWIDFGIDPFRKLNCQK